MAPGELGQQIRVAGDLDAVRVVAGLDGVVDPTAQARANEARDQAQALGQCGVRVLPARALPSRHRRHLIGERVCVERTALDERRQRVGRAIGAISSGIGLKFQGEIVGRGHRRRNRSTAANGKRELRSSEKNGRRRAAAGRRGRIKAPSDPTVAVTALRISPRRMPDRHRLEMRAARVGIADALE